ncbi:MAG: hypothetical protein ABJ056_09975 [Halioglobus sp.]
MSTEFTYGGIERRNFSWHGQGDFTPPKSIQHGPNRDNNSSESHEQRQKEGYVYGGIDRSQVEWGRPED